MLHDSAGTDFINFLKFWFFFEFLQLFNIFSDFFSIFRNVDQISNVKIEIREKMLILKNCENKKSFQKIFFLIFCFFL